MICASGLKLLERSSKMTQIAQSEMLTFHQSKSKEQFKTIMCHILLPQMKYYVTCLDASKMLKKSEKTNRVTKKKRKRVQMIEFDNFCKWLSYDEFCECSYIEECHAECSSSKTKTLFSQEI